MSYSFILMLAQLINAAAALFWSVGNGTHVISGSILFVGYCIVRVMESKK